jgi:hypothetical protein
VLKTIDENLTKYYASENHARFPPSRNQQNEEAWQMRYTKGTTLNVLHRHDVANAISTPCACHGLPEICAEEPNNEISCLQA